MKRSLYSHYTPQDEVIDCERQLWAVTYLSDVNFSILVVVVGLQEALLELGEHGVGDGLQHKALGSLAQAKVGREISRGSVLVGSAPTLLFLAESIFALARSIFAGNNCDARQINRTPLICKGAAPGRAKWYYLLFSSRQRNSPPGALRHFSTICIFARDWNRVVAICAETFPAQSSIRTSLCHCRARAKLQRRGDTSSCTKSAALRHMP